MLLQPEAFHKRALFEGWLAAHADLSFVLATAGQAIDRRAAFARLTSWAGQQGAAEYVYVLLERRQGDDTPAYIGKAQRPLDRWAQHLRGLAGGEGRYARWRRRLLREGHDEARFDLTLYVVGTVRQPPLPGFPISVGAVEYQLVGLAADAYPLPLLNSEGQGR